MSSFFYLRSLLTGNHFCFLCILWFLCLYSNWLFCVSYSLSLPIYFLCILYFMCLYSYSLYLPICLLCILCYLCLYSYSFLRLYSYSCLFPFVFPVFYGCRLFIRIICRFLPILCPFSNNILFILRCFVLFHLLLF